jgi:hypothetical protein
LDNLGKKNRHPVKDRTLNKQALLPDYQMKGRMQKTTEEVGYLQKNSPDNLNRSCRQVAGNGGAGGVDKMGTSELLP